ncbi:peptidase M48 [Geothermobacter hydrogeniphilus]|uniref:Peptidase M48 n=1 Tax=Geothermobacter hydrogeniphilus TaxID=1969733 RepID=A0A2K2HB49_9BACT|nr:M48 family metallopeptidase [Geothermobacter hydrogeniphilus]PNU20548.1 peptidase M48 [Geothermobacter hydrogeniphilus]
MSASFLFLLLAVYAGKLLLRALNLRFLARHGDDIPDGWEADIGRDRLRKANRYTLAGSRLGLLESLFSQALGLLFAFQLLPHYDAWVQAKSSHLVLQGLLFFGLLGLAQALLGLPFSVWRIFVIEARFGFNRTGWRLWLQDLLKGALVSVPLFAALVSGALALVLWSPQGWWLPVWGFMALLSLLLLYISPYLIEPLFFKFSPLRRPGLENRVRELAEGAGIRVSRVQQVDASRRSGHSNAYFTGIGRVKRIVLFDTLLEQLTDGQVLAVLAHELGHWKHGHLRRRLVVGQLVSLASCLAAWWLLQQDWLPRLVGAADLGFCGRLVVLSLLGGLLGFCWTPVSSWLSRRDERQADRYAVQATGQPRDLAAALRRMARENLSNLHPHPLYAAIYFSHPPVVERVAALMEADEGP